MNPYNLSIPELVHYGSQSDNPWILRLSNILHMMRLEWSYCEELNQVNPVTESDIEEAFRKLSDDLNSYRYSIEDAEERADELERDLKETRVELKALKFDTNDKLRNKHENRVVTELKAEVYDLNEELTQESRKRKFAEDKFSELLKNYKELEEKYNTFHILATH